MTHYNWSTINIFESHRQSYGLAYEKELGIERISMYTFHFLQEEQRTVQIQRNIFGLVEKTWNINNPELGSKEAAVKRHWEILEKMAVNDTSIEILLDDLANM